MPDPSPFPCGACRGIGADEDGQCEVCHGNGFVDDPKAHLRVRSIRTLAGHPVLERGVDSGAAKAGGVEVNNQVVPLLRNIVSRLDRIEKLVMEMGKK